ncbi:GPR endopeptidase [Caproicibacter sp.]|uniref:GPR endopeptidase n=1 Tax=Caproicibacter sp. TaxID=2814884 RepID=UPI0039891DDB
MNFRTDLALESTEPAKQVRTEKDGCVMTRIDENGGTYVTMEVQAISDHIDSNDSLLKMVASELEALLPKEGMILAAGLGNRSVTPDALGPLVAEEVLATRYIKGELARVTGLEGLRPVAVISPGVLGCTGMEAFEVLRAVVGEVKPAAVIAVDALAARSPSRLGCTVQLSSAGISPGSGVGNSRPRIDRKTLGVPVVSMGIPTVVDAATLAADLLGREGPQDKIAPRGASMMVTPREVDLIIKRGARLIAMGINRAVNPSLSVEEFEELT